MTRKQLEILQHTLGLDEYGRGEMYRNHFCAGESDIAVCQELIELGYMAQHLTTKWLPYFNCSATDEGKIAVRRESPAPPKRSRSQRNYQAFLDADSGLKFVEWMQARRAGQAERGQ